MESKIVTRNEKQIALVQGDGVLMKDVDSAVDLLMSVQYETGCRRIVMAKELIAEEFFVLSTKIAGEILQKCINYHIKLAIFGDFSGYTSRPLKDFIYESNKGQDFFFVEDEEIALERLSNV